MNNEWRCYKTLELRCQYERVYTANNNNETYTSRWFTHEGFPCIFRSICRSSWPVLERPTTALGWFLPQLCTPRLAPQLPEAFVECPKLELDSHQLQWWVGGAEGAAMMGRRCGHDGREVWPWWEGGRGVAMKRESCSHQGVAKMGGRCGHDRREKVMGGTSNLHIHTSSTLCTLNTLLAYAPLPSTSLSTCSGALLTCSADVAGGVRGPGDPVDLGPMVAEPGHWDTGDTNVQDDHLTIYGTHVRRTPNVVCRTLLYTHCFTHGIHHVYAYLPTYVHFQRHTQTHMCTYVRMRPNTHITAIVQS